MHVWCDWVSSGFSDANDAEPASALAQASNKSIPYRHSSSECLWTSVCTRMTPWSGVSCLSVLSQAVTPCCVQDLWSLATQFGARCYREMCDQVETLSLLTSVVWAMPTLSAVSACVSACSLLCVVVCFRAFYHAQRHQVYVLRTRPRPHSPPVLTPKPRNTPTPTNTPTTQVTHIVASNSARREVQARHARFRAERHIYGFMLSFKSHSPSVF